jgi:hypothetical protein
MDLLMILAAVVTALIGLDLLAVRFGADSRGTIADDHARSAGFGGRTEGLIR